MSHIVSIKTLLHDPAAVAAACRRLGMAQPTQGTVQLYSGEVSGLIVQLPDWRFPVVIDTLSGNVQFDDYAGAWGDRDRLNKFLQMYAVEKTRLEANRKGYQVSEAQLADGSIKLQIQEG